MLADEGIYDAEYVGISSGTNDNGNFHIDIEWYLPEISENRTLQLFLSERAKQWSYKRLLKLGFNGDDNAPAITVTDVKLVCTHSEWNNETQENWNLYDEEAGVNSKKLMNEFKKYAKGKEEIKDETEDKTDMDESGCVPF